MPDSRAGEAMARREGSKIFENELTKKYHGQEHISDYTLLSVVCLESCDDHGEV